MADSRPLMARGLIAEAREWLAQYADELPSIHPHYLTAWSARRQAADLLKTIERMEDKPA